MDKTVYFRTFEETDVDLIYQWKNDDSLRKLSVGLNRKYSKDEILEWVKSKIRYKSDRYFWAICAKDTNKMIGYASLTDVDYVNRTAEFSGITIGDSSYHNGFAWIETYLFILSYSFECLNLNRLYGYALMMHKQTQAIGDALFFKREGVLRQAVFKNGIYCDESIKSILKDEYFEHKNNGDYDIKSILSRFRKTNKK